MRGQGEFNMGCGQPCDSTWGGGGVSLQVCEDRVSLIWGMGNHVTQLGGVLVYKCARTG